MRIAILAYGTRGDIQPMLAVADELTQRGHQVVMTVNEDQAAWASRSGLEIISTPVSGALLEQPEVKRALAKGNLYAFWKHIDRAERAAFPEIAERTIAAARGADLVLSTTVSVQRGHSIAEALNLPHHILLTLPVQPTRAYSGIGFAARNLGAGWLNLWSHHAFYAMLWPLQRKSIRVLRAQLGLPPLRARPRLEDHPTINLFSPTLSPRPKDVAEHHQFVGAPTMSASLRARLGEGAPSEELEAFLAAGPAPVYFGFGSMPVLDPKRWLRDVADVAAKLGVRALVGVGALEAGAVPEHVFVTRAFDHDRILPRCRAAVHHGGAGTTATVARAGLPALIASVNVDQPHWGWRITKLGAGRTVPFRKLDAALLERELREVLKPRYASAAQTLSLALRAERGRERAADAIEAFARTITPAARAVAE